MRGRYFFQNASTTSTDEYRKTDKLHWIWAILLTIIIIVFIALIIIGFYNLPVIEMETAQTPQFYRKSHEITRKTDFFNSFDTQVILNEAQNVFADSNSTYSTEFKISGNFLRSATPPRGDHNIFIKLSPLNSTSNRTILVSGYFQNPSNNSFVTSRNRIAKALVEYLRYLTEFENFLHHPLIILLNEGRIDNVESLEDFFANNQEEAANIGVVINFRTIAGGRENMIETHTNSRLLLDAYYKSFHRPHLCLICNEISKSKFFEAGPKTESLLNSNKIQRLDLLYVYRNESLLTYLSNPYEEEQTQVSLSRDILSLVQYVDRTKELDERVDATEVIDSVFFNFFDVFMIIYSKTDGIIINVIVSIFALTTMLLSLFLMQQWAVVPITDILTEFGISFGLQLASLLMGGGIVIFMAFLYDCYKSFLTWVPEYWLIFAIYFSPFIFVMATFPTLYLGWKQYRPIPIRFGIMLFQHVNCLMFIIAILTLTGLSVQTAFVIVSGIAFYTISMMIVLILRLYKKKYLWTIPILIGQIFPIIFITYLLMIFYSVYVPVAALPGTPRSLQYLLAMSAAAFSMMMFGFTIPIFSIFRKSKTLLCGFVLVMLTFLLLVFINIYFS